jgi:hypothetical protein
MVIGSLVHVQYENDFVFWMMNKLLVQLLIRLDPPVPHCHKFEQDIVDVSK